MQIIFNSIYCTKCTSIASFYSELQYIARIYKQDDPVWISTDVASQDYTINPIYIKTFLIHKRIYFHISTFLYPNNQYFTSLNEAIHNFNDSLVYKNKNLSFWDKLKIKLKIRILEFLEKNEH